MPNESIAIPSAICVCDRGILFYNRVDLAAGDCAQETGADRLPLVAWQRSGCCTRTGRSRSNIRNVVETCGVPLLILLSFFRE